MTDDHLGALLKRLPAIVLILAAIVALIVAFAWPYL
jgi:hypothetical protein